jgi:hypothetical protein
MKIYAGRSGGTAPPFLTLALDGSDQFHATATLAQGKGSRINRIGGLAPKSVWTLWSREKTLTPIRNTTPGGSNMW